MKSYLQTNWPLCISDASLLGKQRKNAITENYRIFKILQQPYRILKILAIY